MTDDERVASFAKFLGLQETELRERAEARGLMSRATFDRIRGGRRKDTAHRHTRTLKKLADFIDPDYLAAPRRDDAFAHTEIARRLRSVGQTAVVAWRDFLLARTDEVPTLASIERSWDRSRVFGLPKADNAGARKQNLDELRSLVDDLERRAIQLGIIDGKRGSKDLLRWRWTGARVDAETRRRLSTAYYLAQTRIEDTADVIYLAAPTLPWVLCPEEVWEVLLSGVDGDAAADLVNRDKGGRYWRKSTRGVRRMFRQAVVAHLAVGREAEGLRHAWRLRCAYLQNGIRLRTHVVVALFDEQDTKKFVAELPAAHRTVWVEHIATLEREGLTLLATKLAPKEACDFCFSLTMGGDTPGIAMGAELAGSNARPSDAFVTLANTPEYRQQRAVFEAILNSRRTRRLRADDIESLVPSATRSGPLRPRRR